MNDGHLHQDLGPSQERKPKRILVLGLGNDLRRDDAVGLLVARALRKNDRLNVTIRESSGDGSSLMDAWDGFDCVFLVDAVSAETIPGSILKVDVHQHRITPRLLFSTHRFGPADAIELARVWGELPDLMFLYGIQAGNIETGSGLSPRVQRAKEEVVAMIERDVADLQISSEKGTAIAPHPHSS